MRLLSDHAFGIQAGSRTKNHVELRPAQSYACGRSQKKIEAREVIMAQKKLATAKSSMMRLRSGMSAFRTLPKAKTKRPAVILLHDRKGLLAGKVRVRLRDNEVLEDLGEILDQLKNSKSVDGARIAVMGVCATGRHSILLQA